MNPRTPSEIGRLWFDELWNRRASEMVHELMAPHAIGFLEGDVEIAGPQGFLEFQKEFLAVMPDLQLEIVDTVSNSTDTCVQWIARGHHTGPGMGLSPSGLQVEFRGVTWLTVEDGQVVAGRDFWNKDCLMGKLAGVGSAAT